MRAGGAAWRIAFNVRSEQKPFPVRYAIDANFQGPLTAAMDALPQGLSPGRDVSGDAVHAFMAGRGLALDFVRGEILSESDLHVLEKISLTSTSASSPVKASMTST